MYSLLSYRLAIIKGVVGPVVDDQKKVVGRDSRCHGRPKAFHTFDGSLSRAVLQYHA